MPPVPQVGGFSWENCGEGKDPVVLQSLSVAPDPISIPGNLRISAAVNGNKAMASPLKVGAGTRAGREPRETSRSQKMAQNEPPFLGTGHEAVPG